MSEQKEKSKLEKPVEAAASAWPAASGDTNLVDVHWLARQIRQDLGATLPTDLPPKRDGVVAFECVESNLLCPQVCGASTCA